MSWDGNTRVASSLSYVSVFVGRERVKFSVLQIKAAADSRTWDNALVRWR